LKNIKRVLFNKIKGNAKCIIVVISIFVEKENIFLIKNVFSIKVVYLDCIHMIQGISIMGNKKLDKKFQVKPKEEIVMNKRVINLFL